MDHKHWSEGTTGGCSDRGMSGAGSHSHSYYGRNQDAQGAGVSYDEGCGTGTIVATPSTSEDGYHSHTINDHTHWWGNWSGWCHYDYGNNNFQGKPYTDGAVVWNGTQYVDRSYTEYNGNATVQECRPKNLTIKIWRRKA